MYAIQRTRHSGRQLLLDLEASPSPASKLGEVDSGSSDEPVAVGEPGGAHLCLAAGV